MLSARFVTHAQDEFYVLPRHSSFQEAFSAGGCLSGLSQARIMRVSAYYGLTAAQAAACPDTRFFHKACQPQHQAGDVADLARMGWRRFFAQPLQYVDARFTIPESPKNIPHRLVVGLGVCLWGCTAVHVEQSGAVLLTACVRIMRP